MDKKNGWSWKVTFQRLITLKASIIYLTFAMKWSLLDKFNDFAFALIILGVVFVRSFEDVGIETPFFKIRGGDRRPEIDNKGKKKR